MSTINTNKRLRTSIEDDQRLKRARIDKEPDNDHKRTLRKQARILMKRGYVVVRVDPRETKRARHLFGKDILEFPEYRSDIEHDLSTDIGAGSFGALNQSSAYHCPSAVYIDLLMKRRLGPIVRRVARKKRLKNWEVLPDRLVYRTQKQPTESYHTDNSRGAYHFSDIFFGSFINLNKAGVNQVFTLVPGTHKFSARMDGGDFTPMTPSAELKSRERVVVVPPSHAILFFENIVHRVSGSTPTTPLIRKFCGFRASNDPRQWCPENIQRMEKQAALAHKGGVIAPMYPKLWRTNWPDKCEAYSKTLVPEMVTTYTYKSGKNKHRTINIPHKDPISLSDLGHKYPLSEEAKNRFKPQAVKKKKS